MKRELRDRWCAALRSGEFTQVHERLVDYVSDGQGGAKESYCCLGVLCKVAGCNPREMCIDEMLSSDACARFGLDPRQGMEAVGYLGSQGDLAHQNDGGHRKEADGSVTDSPARDFNYIADYIEKHVPVED